MFQEAPKTLGERRLVSAVALAAYYECVSMILNVDEYPLPAGAPAGAAKALEPLEFAQIYRKPAAKPAKGFGSGALDKDPDVAEALRAFGRAVEAETQEVSYEVSLALKEIWAPASAKLVCANKQWLA